jgi:hypothetical protein
MPCSRPGAPTQEAAARQERVACVEQGHVASRPRGHEPKDDPASEASSGAAVARRRDGRCGPPRHLTRPPIPSHYGTPAKILVSVPVNHGDQERRTRTGSGVRIGSGGSGSGAGFGCGGVTQRRPSVLSPSEPSELRPFPARQFGAPVQQLRGGRRYERPSRGPQPREVVSRVVV